MNTRVHRVSAAAVLIIIVLSLFPGALSAGGKWVMLENCTLIPNPSNDGDSFHVRVKRREYIFRLYFVDAPETDPTLPDRVNEQAHYFKVTAAEILELGELATRFSAEKLSRPFTVRTCKEDALGRSKNERFYAFVQTSDGDLAEKLVENGLARVYGASGKPTGLLSIKGEWAKLEQLQTDAKAEKIGAWGHQLGRMAVRSHKEGGMPYDRFDDFFHPKGAVASIESLSRSAASKMRQPSIAMVKLNVNNATEDQLKQVPGIGPALAKRIIAARPFKTADDLSKVTGRGRGGRKYEQIRPYFD